MPLPQFPHRRRRGGSLVTAIGEDPLDKREQATDLLNTGKAPSRSWISAGWMWAARIMPSVSTTMWRFLPCGLLARVVAGRIDPRPPFSAPLTLWLSMVAAVGLASFPANSRTSTNSA
ncbi:hypothetical protein FHS74_000670 [Nitrospirillum iridis]|uniref:Uncharacterized protein n=1 Tax=Nitrospirillum iridis TaxID=765888 RepID=A0A7X0AU33_9PROT|nr:hypothetical protein [Nitrospirillum iridis]